MTKKKSNIAINLRDENSRRGEIRKVVNFVSELKRSKYINAVPTMFGLPSNPVYENYYKDDEDIAKGNKAILEYKTIDDENYKLLAEYLGTNGGSIVERRDISASDTEPKILVMIDTTNMRY
jgi:hypothetical protein